MRRPRAIVALVAIALSFAAAALLAGCGEPSGGSQSGRPVIVVTTPVLGAVVAQVVGAQADVQVLMPNGADPHEWRPSAQDVAALDRADLIVESGLGLESGLTSAIVQAREDGVAVFTATDHLPVRQVGAGEGGASDDPDRQAGAADPHFWTDPMAMRRVVLALPAAVQSATGLDVQAGATAEAARLARLNRQVAAITAAAPAGRRDIITGHESLGYFADRYGFSVIGAVTPSLSTGAEASASHVADLAAAARAHHACVVFGEGGTPAAVTEAVASEAGARVVELTTHALPASGGYDAFITGIARAIAGGLGSCA
jgi:zinc/manganese transport system substrate-binding protein